uniref:Uncharacterized protein n=1 Tax=Manihot esculenta TaxID=3983 RepID=A0A2C9VR29_MANES
MSPSASRWRTEEPYTSGTFFCQRHIWNFTTRIATAEKNSGEPFPSNKTILCQKDM